jgi:hypothetical protein
MGVEQDDYRDCTVVAGIFGETSNFRWGTHSMHVLKDEIFRERVPVVQKQ